MATDLKLYKKIGDQRGFDLFRRKSKKGTEPKYVFQGKGITKNEEGSAENLTDIKILAEERYFTIFGPGVVSGYRFSSPPPEGVYRQVIIGKFLYRDNTIALPRFMAKIIPQNIGRDTIKFLNNTEIVTGFTVLEVREKIDKAIETLSDDLKQYFPVA